MWPNFFDVQTNATGSSASGNTHLIYGDFGWHDSVELGITQVPGTECKVTQLQRINYIHAKVRR